MTPKILVMTMLVALAVAGCTRAQERRATTGAVIGGAAGAVTGAAITGDAGGALAGGAIGAAGGAAVGAATAPRWCRGVDRAGNPIRYRC
jgi:osmotically inducible lipoprotein OsmB